MSSANANSSLETKKGLLLAKFNPIAAKFDKEVVIIPTNVKDSFSFSVENGISEITAYTNPVVKSNGKTRRVNKKTGKAYKTRIIPKRLDNSNKEHTSSIDFDK